jgi:hypothetical protein
MPGTYLLVCSKAVPVGCYDVKCDLLGVPRLCQHIIRGVSQQLMLGVTPTLQALSLTHASKTLHAAAAAANAGQQQSDTKAAAAAAADRTQQQQQQQQQRRRVLTGTQRNKTVSQPVRMQWIACSCWS